MINTMDELENYLKDLYEKSPSFLLEYGLKPNIEIVFFYYPLEF